MMIKPWITAMRLRTLPLALSSVLMGSALAYGSSIAFGKITGLAILTTILLQILSNLANDLGDGMKGTDNDDRVGPQRAIQSGQISISGMKKAVILFSVLSFISGLLLIYTCFWMEGRKQFLWIFLALGILAIAGALWYTMGKRPYGYRGFGDISVLFFFGILGVGGTYFLHTAAINWSIIPISLAIGLLATSVLNLNNLRDIENDKKSNKNTLAVILGFKYGKVYHYLLIATAWICIIITILTLNNPVLWALLIVFPLHVAHLIKVNRTKENKLLDPELKKIALSTFMIAMISFVILIFL